jgi:hypothetical protein
VAASFICSGHLFSDAVARWLIFVDQFKTAFEQLKPKLPLALTNVINPDQRP